MRDSYYYLLQIEMRERGEVRVRVLQRSFSILNDSDFKMLSFSVFTVTKLESGRGFKRFVRHFLQNVNSYFFFVKIKLTNNKFYFLLISKNLNKQSTVVSRSVAIKVD